MQTRELESDVSFLRTVIDRSETRRSPISIYLLWALIVLVGFPLIDFAPRYVGPYWMVMGPLGTVISMFLGWQHARRSGQLRRHEGFLYFLHWGGLLVVIALAYLMVARNVVDIRGFHQIILLLLAWTYFLGGLHLERPMMWVGLLIAVGYVAVLWISTYAWTLFGVVVSLALVLSALLGGGRRAQLES